MGTHTQCGTATKWILALLLAVVLLQSAVIVKLGMALDLDARAEDGRDCSSVHGHEHIIQKRATTPYCPPGCVRRRLRTTTTTRAPMPRAPSWTAASYDYGQGYGYNYNYGSDGLQGARGPSGARGSPGQPGQRGSAGAPGSPGLSGTPGEGGMAGAAGQRGATGGQGVLGVPGGRGSPGATGWPGVRGMAGTPGSPGGRGSPGEAGTPGPRGPPGGQGGRGVMGAPGGYGSGSYRPQQDSAVRWPSPRGDQVIRGAEEEPDTDTDAEAARKKQLAHVLDNLRLYDHPACVNAFDHEQVVGKLRDEGKASFMIMVDLAKSVYCIVHA